MKLSQTVNRCQNVSSDRQNELKCTPIGYKKKSQIDITLKMFQVKKKNQYRSRNERKK